MKRVRLIFLKKRSVKYFVGVDCTTLHLAAEGQPGSGDISDLESVEAMIT
jgi:hypothetical protein